MGEITGTIYEIDIYQMNVNILKSDFHNKDYNGYVNDIDEEEIEGIKERLPLEQGLQQGCSQKSDPWVRN